MRTYINFVIGVVVAASFVYLRNYNVSVLSGDFPSLGYALSANLASGIFFSFIIYTMVMVKRELNNQ